MPVLRPFDVIQTYSPCMHTNRSLESGALLAAAIAIAKAQTVDGSAGNFPICRSPCLRGYPACIGDFFFSPTRLHVGMK
jgi:hypothetical protein